MLLNRYAKPNGSHTFSRDEIYSLAKHIIENDARFDASSYREINPEEDNPNIILQAVTEQVNPPFARFNPIGDELNHVMRTETKHVSPDRLKKIEQKIGEALTQDLVSLMLRPVERLYNLSAPTPKSTYLQRVGQLVFDPEKDSAQISYGSSQSSDGIKADRQSGNAHMLNRNANLASITTEGKLIVGRSARSDTTARIEELLLFNAIESLRAAGPGNSPSATGVDALANGVFSFQMAISSAMDRSWQKEWAAKFGVTENEAKFLKRMDLAVNDLFGEQSHIDRKVVGPEGTSITVRLQRPLMLNFTLSGQTRNTKNIKNHRKANTPAFMNMYRALSKKWAEGDDQLLRQIGSRMRGAANLDHMQNILTSMDDHYNALQPKQQMALDSLRLTLCGSDFGNRKLLEASDPGKEFILTCHLLDELNVAISVQCKSGQDRTLTQVALKTACDIFEQEHNNRPFCPQNPPEQELADFQRAFTDAANRFGEHMVKTVRGFDKYGKAKWDAHVVPRDYYLPDRNPEHPIGEFVWGKKPVHRPHPGRFA